MRATFAVVGTVWSIVLGVGGLAPLASAQPFDFTTVLSSSTPVPGAPGGGVLADVGQVVLHDDGAVAAITRFSNGVSSPVPAVTFNATPGNGSATIVAHQGQTLFGGSGGTFDEFSNLSSIGGKVTFLAEAQTSANLGLFRYAHDPVTPARFAIQREADAISGSASSLDTGGFTPTPYGVNAAGRLAFGGVTTGAPAAQFIARWDGAAAPTRTVDTSSGLSNFNEPESFYTAKKVLTASDTTVFVAEAAGSRRIYAVDSGGASPVQRVGTMTVGADTYVPARVLGATGAGTGGSTLFIATQNAAPADPSHEAMMLTAGGVTQVLGDYDFAPDSGPPATGFEASAVMSAAGGVAALIPDPAGGRAVFHDGSPGGAIETIASIGTSVGGGFSISAIAPVSSAPMVNDNGVVVFDALVSDATHTDLAALIAWQSDFAAPIVVVKAGDVVDVDGVPRTVSAILSNLPAPANVLGYDADVLKDGLNENNMLAFAIVYTDGSGAGLAVLQTTVPEPAAAIVLMPLGAAVLLRRVRRRKVNV